MFSELRTKFPNYSGLLGGQLPPEEAINLRYWLARALDRLAGPNGTLSAPLDKLREEAKPKRPPGPLSKG